VGNPKVPPLVYGAEPVNPALLDQFNLLQASFVATQDLANAVAQQTTTAQNALIQQNKLESYKTTLTTLRSQVSVLRQQASTSLPIPTSLIAQLDLLLKQIDNLIARINSSVQLVEQAKTQLQRR
jgi:molybdopterin/thiamine biosynthesis adenylyltransferase